MRRRLLKKHKRNRGWKVPSSFFFVTYLFDDRLNTSTGAGSQTFYFDYQNGSFGFNTSSARGADTFNPFNQGSDVTKLYHSDTMLTSTTTIPITGSSAYDYLIVEAMGHGTVYGTTTQYIMLDKTATSVPYLWRYNISGGGRGVDFSRSGDNLVVTYPSGFEGWGNTIKNVWGGNTITPPLSAIGARTNVTVHADQWGYVYFDITVYDKDNTLVYTASRINWGFTRTKHAGVNGSFNVNASDLDNVQITNSYSTYNL